MENHGTTVTEHPTRVGKVYCYAVIDAWSRRVVGWAIESSQRADLATNALGMAICSRTPGRRGQHAWRPRHPIHLWTFTERARSAGLLLSLRNHRRPLRQRRRRVVLGPHAD